ncbi:MAG: hypothetical protein COB66_00710 [Coxiella sp. (in: Bacteria)]|nr:MAG: hypothetical protein COB66_00710 [Coxiella sp. (in: g-proteobacteria)]
MSRAPTSKNWVRPEELNGFSVIKELGSGTSGNRVKVVGITDDFWGGVYYQKYFPHSELAQFEAILLAMQGVPLTDLLVIEDPLTSEPTLLSRDNGMTSIKELFETRAADLERLPITDRLLRSLIKLLLFDLHMGNGDRHKRNIGMNEALTHFLGIDLDGVELLIAHNLKDSRYGAVNFSKPHCFNLTPDHFNELFTACDKAYPNYHPFADIPLLQQAVCDNAYTSATRKFFERLRNHARFEPILLEEIIAIACADTTKVDDYCNRFNLDQDNRDWFIPYADMRTEQWRDASLISTRVQKFLAQSGNLATTIRHAQFSDKERAHLDDYAAKILIPRLVQPCFIATINIIRNEKKPLANITTLLKSVVTILQNLMCHQSTLTAAINNIEPLIVNLASTSSYAAVVFSSSYSDAEKCVRDSLYQALTTLRTHLNELQMNNEVPSTDAIEFDASILPGYERYASEFTGQRPNTVFVCTPKEADAARALSMSVCEIDEPPVVTMYHASSLPELDEDSSDSSEGEGLLVEFSKEDEQARRAEQTSEGSEGEGLLVEFSKEDEQACRAEQTSESSEGEGLLVELSKEDEQARRAEQTSSAWLWQTAQVGFSMVRPTITYQPQSNL